MERCVLVGKEGIRLVGDLGGPADAPLIVLSHGGGQTRGTWKRTAEDIVNQKFGVFYYDLRGHGESGWSETGQYRPEDYVGDLQAIVSVLGKRRPIVLVGASLGGIASLLTAASDTDSVEALVMIDVTPRVNREGANRIRGFMELHKDGFQNINEAADAVAAFKPQSKRPSDASGLARNLRKDATSGRYYWHWDPKIMQSLGSREDRARSMATASSRLTVPTLLIRGMQSDVVTPIEVEDFKTRLPTLEVIDVSDAGHMVVGDRNDAFLAGIREFLQRTLRHSQAL